MSSATTNNAKRSVRDFPLFCRGAPLQLPHATGPGLPAAASPTTLRSPYPAQPYAAAVGVPAGPVGGAGGLHSRERHHSAPYCPTHGDGYQIVAGERRWRAATRGLAEVPVVVQDIADPHMLELALIENIQREDLNPIETAHAYERLDRDMGFHRKKSDAAPARTEPRSQTPSAF